MKTKIAIIGEFQDGKSTLINALLGKKCAETGQGTATTAAVAEYPVPGTDCILLDTPGFNSTRTGDSTTTHTGVQRADAFILMLSTVQVTDALLDEVDLCMQSGSKGRRPLIPIINDRYRNNEAICRNSIATMRRRGVNPILFGDEMPCFNARRWEKGRSDEDDSDGIRRMRYLLGIEPRQVPSPLARVCGMMSAVQRLRLPQMDNTP